MNESRYGAGQDGKHMSEQFKRAYGLEPNKPAALADIVKERKRQEQLKADGKFTFTCADPISNATKLAILAEEFGEVAKEVTDMLIFDAKGHGSKTSKRNQKNYEIGQRAKLRDELVQVAAVCVAWCEALDKEE